MSAGRLYIAVVGLETGTGQPVLAVSADGLHFTSSPLPTGFQAGAAAPFACLPSMTVSSWPTAARAGSSVCGRSP
jgi:hypothetical protein